MTSAAVFVPAYAKINLTLSALRRRPDGYHDLASVMQTVSLHDTLRFGVSESSVSDTFSCDVPELAGPDNLVARAMALLRAVSGQALPAIDAQLHKAVPTQGGLGGGSSDAAATLVALNTLLGIGLDRELIEELAGRLGSDVPYLVTGGAARIRGRGETVEPLPDAEPLWIALVTPAQAVSTAAVFRALTTAHYGDEAATESLVATMRAGRPLPFESLENTLESAVFSAYPEVARVRERMLTLGAPLVRMSGSGPSLFAPYRTLTEAAELVRRVSASGERAWLCHTVTRASVAASRPRGAVWRRRA